jgi:hypothetical protein
LAPVRTVVPVPAWSSSPLPEMVPASVNVSDRLTANCALLMTLPTMLPVVPPSPSRSMPALIVVPPV